MIHWTSKAQFSMKCTAAFTPTISASYKAQEPILTLLCLSPWKSWHPPVPQRSCVCLSAYQSVRLPAAQRMMDGMAGGKSHFLRYHLTLLHCILPHRSSQRRRQIAGGRTTSIATTISVINNNNNNNNNGQEYGDVKRIQSKWKDNTKTDLNTAS